MKSTIVIKLHGDCRYIGATVEKIVDSLPDGKYRIFVEKSSEKRTISQNNLMWMWMKCIEDNTGTMKEDVYSYYCRKFLSRSVVIGGHEQFVNDTSSHLSIERMTEFLNNIQADASSELGIVLPLPSDLYYKEFIDEYKNKI